MKGDNFMFGDKSKRTARISKYAIMTATALGGIVIGGIGYGYGTLRYNHDVAWSSTPIGQTLKFNRSKASLTVGGLYTTPKKDVMIVQLKPAEDDTSLPYKGKDYKIYVQSKSTDGLKEIPVMFGRMSTDGDLFLIIPNITDQVYKIFLMNNNYISTNDIQINTNKQGADLDEASITKALSDYGSGSQNFAKGEFIIKGSTSDITALRLTLNPAFKTKAYLPTVIDADLLKTDGDSQTFDFETLFNLLYKEPVVTKLRKQYKDETRKLDQFNKSVTALEQRVADNPDDTNAAGELVSAREKVKAQESNIGSITKQLNRYEKLEYSDDMFKDLQTKAKVITK